MDLTFEDSEIVVQVMCHTVPGMTAKQVIACWLQTLGFTQQQIAVGMGLDRTTVCRHVKAGMDKIRGCANSYTH